MQKVIRRLKVFLNCMYSNSLFPVITKPTRVTSSSATLIENLFTNAIANAQSFTGILYADVSDHFPIFYIDHSTKVKIPHKYIRKRIYSPENLQKFTDACDAHEWNNVLASNGAQDAFTLYHNEFTEIYNSCFSIKNIKSSYEYRKPWLSEGLRKSIKYKNKLYRVKMRSNSPEAALKYNMYRNKLHSLLRAVERDHFDQLLSSYKNNLKKSWMVIKELINKKKIFKVILTFLYKQCMYNW